MSKIMSDRLKQLRKEKGFKQGHKLSQEQAAKDMNMSRTTLAKYENPDTDSDSMRVTELMILAKYYNCDPRYITGDISCKDKEVSDIHDATGLSEDAIKVLMTMRDHNKPFFRTDKRVGIDFISQMIANMNFDIVIRHIHSLAWAQISQDESVRFNKKLDESQRLKSALKNKAKEDKQFVSTLYEISSDLLNDYENMQNAADASYLRFTQAMGNILDSFSEEEKKIVQEEIYEKYGGKERLIAEMEREVFEDEER